MIFFLSIIIYVNPHRSSSMGSIYLSPIVLPLPLHVDYIDMHSSHKLFLLSLKLHHSHHHKSRGPSSLYGAQCYCYPRAPPSGLPACSPTQAVNLASPRSEERRGWEGLLMRHKPHYYFQGRMRRFSSRWNCVSAARKFV